MSDPLSPEYGHYRSVDELRSLLAPQRNLGLLHDWLAGHGVTELAATASGDFLLARTTAAVATALAGGAPFAEFERAVGGGRVQRVLRTTRAPVLPAHVLAAVDVVLGLSDFPLRPKRRPRTAARPSLRAAAG